MEEKLFMKKENGWKNLDTRNKEAIFSFCNGYINFLNHAKTEREAIVTEKKIAESNGFSDISTFNACRSIALILSVCIFLSISCRYF